MADIALSSGVRTNLQSLQNIANLLTTSQERLSTGKKVNSALDNPASFFTARGFSDRAESLNGLLDGMSTGIQTIKAANTGLDTISKLLKQATSVAQQFKANGGYSAFVVAGDTPIGNLGAGATIKDKTRAALLSDNGVGAGETLTFTTVSGGVSKSFSFVAAAGKKIGDLVDAVNASGVASAKVNDNGTLTFEAKATTSFTIASHTALTDGDLGVSAAASFVPGAPTTVTGDGADYSGQFVDLLTQITNAATDANFNGINLLAAGNQLDVTFDTKSGNNLTVNSQDVSSTALGLSFTALDSSNVDTVLSKLDDAVNTVQGIQRGYGNKLSIIETRQDFATNLVNILKTGSDKLTLADQNEEAANVLALQTRQALSQSALSLANQADQAVLSLFR